MPNPNFLSSEPLLAKSQQVAAAVREQGGRALLVGGYVRDTLLGLTPKDADLEVFGLEAPALRHLLQQLGRVNCVGESFRVYKLAWHQRDSRGARQRYELDVSLPRRDRRVGRGHRGFEIEGDPQMTVEEAARRRDFTINAMLSDPLTGELIDPFRGRADLEARVLRMVDARHFSEDSLRVLRAVQFAARFELTVEEQTAQFSRSIPLDDLPAERIWGEWEKLLLKARRPSIGLRVAEHLDVLEKLFPALQIAMRQRGEELCQALDDAVVERESLPYARKVTLMLAVLGSFLGWRGTKALLETLRVFKLDGYNVRAEVIKLVGERKRVSDWFRHRETIADQEFRFLAARCEPRMIARLARARGCHAGAAWFEEHMATLGVLDGPPPPLLQGRHLIEMGLQPGPLIGKIVNAVWIQQMKGEVSTPEEAIALARELIESEAKTQRPEA